MRALLVLSLLACGAKSAKPEAAGPVCAPIDAKDAAGPARQVLQVRHTGEVSGMSFAPDGVLVTASEDGTIRQWDVAHQRLLRVIQAGPARRLDQYDHTKGVKLALSLDGTTLAYAADDTRLTTFDRSGKRLATGFAVTRWRGVLAAFGDGWLVAEGDGASVRSLERCDVTEADKIQMPDAPPGKTRLSANWELAVSGDGKTVALNDWRGQALWIWQGDPRTTKPRRVDLPRQVEGSPSLSHDGRIAIVALKIAGAVDSELAMIDVANPGAAPRMLPGKTTGRPAAISRDGRFVAQPFVSLRVWDTKTGKYWDRRPDKMLASALQLSEFGNAHFRSAAFSPDGRYLVGGQDDGRILVFDPESGRKLGELGRTTALTPAKLQWLDADRLVMLGREDAAVWSLAKGEPIAQHGIRDVFAVGPDGKGGLLFARTLPDPKLRSNALRGCKNTLTPFAFQRWAGPNLEPTDEPVLCLDDRPFVKDVHIASRRALEELGVADNEEMYRRSRGAATQKAGPGWAIEALGPGTRIELEALTPSPDRVVHDPPSFSSDGKWVGALGASLGDSDGTFTMKFFFFVWDAATGKLAGRMPIPQPTRGIAATPSLGKCESARKSDSPTPITFSFSSDGKRVALATRYAIGVYEIPSGKQVWQADGTATSMAFNGADLVVTRGNTAVIYRNGVAQSPVMFDAILRGVEIDPTGKIAAGITGDGSIRLFELATGVVRGTLILFDDGEHIAYTPGGAYVGTTEVGDRVGWAYEGPGEVFPFEQFEAFRKPDIVKRRLTSGAPDIDVTVIRPPQITVTAAPPRETGDSKTRIRVQAHSTTQVESVRVFVEGNLVASQRLCKRDGEVELEVPLVPGANAITVEAFDDRGRSSNPAGFFVASTAPVSQPAELWVHSFGVSKYPGLPEDLQLGFADDDATGLASTFARYAGPGAYYAKAHIRTLTDEAVTKQSVIAALGELERMRPQDTAVVFFGGHGFKISESSEMLFLTGEVQAPSGMLDAATAKRAGIGWSEIGAQLAKAKGRVLVLLDACHSGHLIQDLIVPNDQLAGALLSGRRTGVVVFAAAKGRQPSFEPSGVRALKRVGDAKDTERVLRSREAKGDHGFFTAAVLAALTAAESDHNGNGAIDIDELVDEVTQRVHKRSSGLQTPWLARRAVFGGFHVAPLDKTATQPKPASDDE